MHAPTIKQNCTYTIALSLPTPRIRSEAICEQDRICQLIDFELDWPRRPLMHELSPLPQWFLQSQVQLERVWQWETSILTFWNRTQERSSHLAPELTCPEPAAIDWTSSAMGAHGGNLDSRATFLSCLANAPLCWDISWKRWSLPGPKT